MRSGLFLQPGIDGTNMEKTKKVLNTIKPGSIVLLGRDFNGIDSLRNLIRTIFSFYDKELKIQRPIIAIDQEGGNVVRIRDLDYLPSNYALGVLGSQVFARYAGNITGHQLREVGIYWNLAPVLDTFSNSDNPIVMERSFGANPEVVSRLGEGYIEGIQAAGVAATAKHFPGHGYVREDSHLKLPVDGRGADSIMNSITPFKSAIKKDVKSIMMSHIKYEALDPDFPASMSNKIMSYLRKDLGFQNLIITDSLDMKAISANFSVAEFTKSSFSGGADVLECADPDLALEIFEHLEKRAEVDTKQKEERLLRMNIHPSGHTSSPPEVMNWISVNAIKWIRKKKLDLEKRVFIVPLRNRGDESSWPFTMYQQLGKKLNDLKIENEIRYLNDELKLENANVIFIGKNLHLSETWKMINELSNSNKCCFVSTGIPVDSSLLNEQVGYISAMSEKLESVLASLYSILGFYDPGEIEGANL
jgi:beta-N-acetylhexosaminidase